MKKTKIPQLCVLLGAILQQISPYFSNFDNNNGSKIANDPIITPAGYAFVIWGVITLLASAYGIYQQLPNRKNAALHQRLAGRLVIIYIFFAVWLFAASNNWLAVTVIIFITMFYFLQHVFIEILKNKKTLTQTENILLLGQIAIYTGWTTVAIFANIASMIKFYGVTDLGIIGNTWQTAILIFALCNSLYFILKSGRNTIYICTILWAFIAVFIGIIENQNTLILATTTISAIITVTIFGFLPNKYLPKFYKN
jgi:hypothetical protein